MTCSRLSLIVLWLLWISAANGQTPAGNSAEGAAAPQGPPATSSPDGGSSSGQRMLGALWQQSQTTRDLPPSHPPSHIQEVQSKIDDLKLERKDYENKVEQAQKKLEAVALEQKKLQEIKAAATRLREETRAEPPQPAEPVPTSEELADDSGAKDWFDNFSQSEPTNPRRTLEEIDADLAANGLNYRVDGQKFALQGPQRPLSFSDNPENLKGTTKIESLEQLDKWIEMQELLLQFHESTADREKIDAQKEADRAAENQRNRENELREMEADNQRRAEEEAELQRDIRTAEKTRELIDELGVNDLFEALVEEFTPPSQPSTSATNAATAATTEAPAADRSAVPDGSTSELIDNLAGDLMSREEYDRRLEERERQNESGPVLDEETRRQAAAINQQLAATEAALAEAERRHQQLIQQNAQAEQIQRALAQQEAIRRQWIQQQYQQQNFNNMFGIRAGQPPISIQRFGGSSTPTPSRPQSSAGSGGRRGGNAAGIKDLFSPVTDPNRAQQYEQTFGNRKKR